MRSTNERARSRLSDFHSMNGLDFWAAAKKLAAAADAVAKAPLRAITLPRETDVRRKMAANLDDLLAKVALVRDRVAGDDAALASAGLSGDALHLKKMVDDGQLLDTLAFADLRSVSLQAVSKALSAHRVFYVEVSGRRYFPSFQLHPSLERRQVEKVCQDLGELPGPSKYQFFVTPKASLGGKTPLAALAAGKFSQVRVAAQGFADR